MSPAKLTRTASRSSSPPSTRPWSALSGLRADGYEIRNGVVHGTAARSRRWFGARGSVLATTVHGLLENPEIVHALFGVRVRDPLEDTFDLLADAVDAHLDTDLLRRLTTGS